MDGVFSVDGERLGLLDSQEAVVLLHSILHAESSVIGGVDQSKISVPSTNAAVTTPDGGIDAEVLDATPDSRSHGIIKVGRTSYQIKTGSFNVSSVVKANEIVKLLNKDEFKPRVEACLKDGGTLVVVLFGSDNPDTSDQASVGFIRQAIEAINPDYKDANIEVWHQNNIVGFLSHFPSIRLGLQGQPLGNLRDINTWSRLDDMKRDMVIGEKQEELIAGIKTSVGDTQVEPLRLLGDPGVGKTRTALEALKGVEQRSLVVYAESPAAIPDGFLNRFLQRDNTEHAILVVDECDPIQRSNIWNKVKDVADRIKLVTIYNVEEAPLPDMVQLDAEPLTDEQIVEILTSDPYNIPKENAQRLATLCSGSPRVAHIVAQDVAKTGNVNINSREDLWKRYVAGTEAVDSELYRKRLAVLKWIALFRRFGYDRPLNEEGDMIGKKIAHSENITDGEFRAIVKDLRNKKILQGTTTLYITPKLLHIWLWILWWDEHGGSFDYQSFITVDETTQLTQKLIGWFGDMLKYGRESTSVPKIVEDLLKNPFGDPDFLDSEHGSSLIQILASVDQEAVLKFIEDRLSEVSTEELRHFKKGRRGFVNALEGIAVSPRFFERSAQALLKLAEAENETWANNATGTFASLFSNAYGQVASSAASPEKRFPVLQRAIKLNNPDSQKAVIAAIDQGLEASHFSRMIADDGSGLLDKVERWTPKTYGELWDCYRRIWTLAFDNLATFSDDNRKDLISHMINHLRGLISRLGIKKEIIGWIRELIKSDYVDNRDILKEVTTILRYDKDELPPETIKDLEAIKDELIGTGYDALMRRWVGINMLEDEIDENGNRSNRTEIELAKLAKESLDDTEKLNNLLPWLVSNDPDNSYGFGFQLGKIDGNNKLIDILLDAQRKADQSNIGTQFLAGYLQSLRSRNENEWELILDKLAKDSKLRVLVPDITWRSGMTDRAMRRIIKLSKDGVVEDHIFRIFGYGSSLEPLSQSVFEELIEYLLTSTYESMDSIVLDYAAFFYDMKKLATIPEDLGFRILTQPSLFIPRDANKRSQMDDYYWGKVAEEYITQYPNKVSKLARVIIDHFGEDGTIVDGYRNEATSILKKIIKLDPEGLWKLISPRISKLKNGADLRMMWWLSGNTGFDRNDGVLSLFPEYLLWEWVDEDVESRVRLMASYIPNRLYKDDGTPTVARGLLVRYGDRADVRDAFTINNGNGGWSGDASVHYTSRLNYYLDMKQRETDPNVIRWIDEFTADLKKQIERARIDEERDDRH